LVPQRAHKIVQFDQHLTVKRNILLVFLVLSAITLKAQTNYNYMPYAFGVSASSVRAYTNVAAQHDNIAETFDFTYYYSPFVPLSADVQIGNLSGGSIVTDPYKRQYANSYQALILHEDLQLGEIIDYSRSDFLNFIKNVYGGTGVGAIKNNLTVQRTSINDPSYVFPGSDNSINIVLPFRVGYEYKIFNFWGEPSIRIFAEYEHNFVFGEGLDGYNDPSNRFKNNYTNQYRQITLGIKIDFGDGTAYTKAQ
jgi:hypothetical protein